MVSDADLQFDDNDGELLKKVHATCVPTFQVFWSHKIALCEQQSRTYAIFGPWMRQTPFKDCLEWHLDD